jgi:hypothetical protein
MWRRTDLARRKVSLLTLLMVLLAALPARALNPCGESRSNLCDPTRSTLAQTALDGDCNGDGCVEINELILGVIAELNGEDPASACAAYNCNGNLGVHVDCLIGAIVDALRSQCSGSH